GGLLEVRGALHGADEIWNKVGPALIDRLDVGPLLIHGLLEGDEPVVSPAAAEAEEQGDEQNSSRNGDKFFHRSGWCGQRERSVVKVKSQVNLERAPVALAPVALAPVARVRAQRRELRPRPAPPCAARWAGSACGAPRHLGARRDRAA